MDDDELAEVIPHPSARPGIRSHHELEARLDELTVRPKRSGILDAACRHRGSFVDSVSRKVVCRSCSVELDPIHVLAQLAHDREREILHARSLRLEIDSLTVRKTKLEREERNAKARIRRARSIREDRAALEAAARTQTTIGLPLRVDGYRPFDQLNPDQQEVVLERLRRVIEHYHDALDVPPAEQAGAA